MWASLPDDVREELLDPRFENRTHGTRGTYAKAADKGKGCRGPLCRKAERDQGANKYARRQARQGKVARTGLKDDKVRERDDLLALIADWHYRQRHLAKLNRLVMADDEPDDLEAAV